MNNAALSIGQADVKDRIRTFAVIKIVAEYFPTGIDPVEILKHAFELAIRFIDRQLSSPDFFLQDYIDRPSYGLARKEPRSGLSQG